MGPSILENPYNGLVKALGSRISILRHSIVVMGLWEINYPTMLIGNIERHALDVGLIGYASELQILPILHADDYV
jgi:hypothetical protein